MEIVARLAQVQADIAAAAQRAGRLVDTVHLVAVSKTKPAAAVEAAYAAGQRDFGENYVQEHAAKAQALAHLPGIRWHHIGHLQTNKVKYLAAFVHLIHSLDRTSLLTEIEKQAAKAGRTVDCLIQLNISGEDSKEGTDEAGAEALLQALPQHPHVRVLGLMGMSALDATPAEAEVQFRRLADALQLLRRYAGPQVLPHHLSMGMSGDYAQAIAAGATLVRIGSAIFGSRS